MNRHRVNDILFAVEVSTYSVLAMLFAFLGIRNVVSNSIANIIYIAFVLISFGYLFLFEFVFVKYDNAVHYKMLQRYYVPTGKEKRSYARKGIIPLIILWFVYLVIVALLKRRGMLSWWFFLVCACGMFILNSIFIRKKCLLSVLFLHNKNHCCKNCGVNCWDYAIFASALIFAPKLSYVATCLNFGIIIVSFMIFVLWEINYHRHAYRFYAETNQTLQCKGCLKQCKYRNEGSEDTSKTQEQR